MIRGIQKRVVIVNIKDSKVFESAYFIMKNKLKLEPEGENAAMLAEANRIIAESLPKKKPHKVRRAVLKFLFVNILLASAAILGRFSHLWF